MISKQEAIGMINRFQASVLLVEELAVPRGIIEPQELVDAKTRLHLSATNLFRGLTGDIPSAAVQSLLNTV